MTGHWVAAFLAQLRRWLVEVVVEQSKRHVRRLGERSSITFVFRFWPMIGVLADSFKARSYGLQPGHIIKFNVSGNLNAWLNRVPPT